MCKQLTFLQNLKSKMKYISCVKYQEHIVPIVIIQ